ncbi:GTPase [Actinocatenispora sera]|uniref:GTPase n=1 Tax=Actinocatenispora sera TaxID=390989 RepID=UPI003407EDD7
MSRPEAARTGADDDADPEMTAWIQQLASDEPLPDPHRPAADAAAEPAATPAPDAVEPTAVPDRPGRAHRGSHRRGGRARAAASGATRPDDIPTEATAGDGPAAPTTGTVTDHGTDRPTPDGGEPAATGAADGSIAVEPQHPADRAHHPAGPARYPTGTAQHPTDTRQRPDNAAQHPTGTPQHPTSAAQHPAATAPHSDDAAQRPAYDAMHRAAGAAPHPAGLTEHHLAGPRGADSETGSASDGSARHPVDPATQGATETTWAASALDGGSEPSLPVPTDPAQPATPGDGAAGRAATGDPATHHGPVGQTRHQAGIAAAGRQATAEPAERTDDIGPAAQVTARQTRNPAGIDAARDKATAEPAERGDGTAEPQIVAGQIRYQAGIAATGHEVTAEPAQRRDDFDTAPHQGPAGQPRYQGGIAATGQQVTAEAGGHRRGTGAVDPTTQPTSDGDAGPETTQDPAMPQEVPLGDLPARLRALGEFAAATGTRVDADRLAPVHALLARADERLALSERHTVVVLAGTTGSGKSRLFNALTGLDLSRVGARRPTTADPHACIWEPAGTGPLLDWLGVPPENRTERESVLDGDAQRALHGLVLIDMPDFDSIERGHRPMVERLIGSADMVLWVLDPQKYADRTVHERYLSSLADRDAALTVVLNQVDRLPESDVDQLAADLRRLLAEDGLAAVPVHLASARTGLGVAALRSALADAVASRQAATVRIAADLTATADGLVDLTDAEPPAGVAVDELADRLAAHVGVAGLVDAAEQDMRRRGRRATGWLFVRRALGGRNPDRILAQERYDLEWLDDTTPADPTAAGTAGAMAGVATAGAAASGGTGGPAHADRGTAGTAEPPAAKAGAARTAGPGTGAAGAADTRGAQAGSAPAAAANAGAGTTGPTNSGGAPAGAAAELAVDRGPAVRPSGAGGRHEANDDATRPVPDREAPRRIGLGGVLRASLGPVLERLPAPWRDSLRAVLTEQVPTLAGRLAALPAQAARGTRPAWWTVLGVLQWVFGVGAVAGAAWLIAAAVSASVPDPGLAALWLLAGGVLAGVLASLVAVPLVRRAARNERSGVDAALRAAVAAAARDCVQAPVEGELTAYRAAHAALAAARRHR